MMDSPRQEGISQSIACLVMFTVTPVRVLIGGSSLSMLVVPFTLYHGRGNPRHRFPTSTVLAYQCRPSGSMEVGSEVVALIIEFRSHSRSPHVLTTSDWAGMRWRGPKSISIQHGLTQELALLESCISVTNKYM